MKFKAVLFDLDGTLINTLRDIADSTNNSLLRLGFPPHEIAAYKYFIGDGREMLALRVLPEKHRNKETIGKLVSLINEEYDQFWRQHSFPYNGIPELLDQLTARKIKMAVLSNKAHYFTEIMVKQILAQWHFDLIIGISSEVAAKPNPEATQRIAQYFKIKPGQFIFLGDTGTDMKTATAAGMYPVGALWGFRTAEELISGGAKRLVTCPLDLINLF